MPKIPMPEKKNLNKEELLYVSDAALLDLADLLRSQSDLSASFSEPNMKVALASGFLGNYVSRLDFSQLIDHLVNQGFLFRYEDKFAGAFYEVANEVFVHVDEEAQKSDTLYGLMRRFGSELMSKALHTIFSTDESLSGKIETNHSSDAVPAANRFVSVNHNSVHFENTVKALDEFIEKAPTDNSFCDLVVSDDDRAVIMSEALTLKSMLVAPKLNPNTVTAIAFAFLWLAENLAGGIIGELAAAIYKGAMALVGG